MSFGAPEWFWGFLLVPVLGWFFVRNEMLRDGLLKKLVASRLLGQLAASASAPRRRWKFSLALLGLACVIAALTQPRLGYSIQETHRRGLDVMIAVDTSKSMLSTDVQPDRLTRAKYAAQDLIDSLDGDRVGLIAFAGTSFVQAPLTIDYSAVGAALEDLDTNTIPRGGTNIASAIRQAADAFGKGEGAHRALIIFTDGEELEDDAVQAARDVNGAFRIFTVGVGTREGSLIPIAGADGQTDFVKDDQGQYVKSHLDEEKLKAIAQATGGFYIHLDNGPATAKAIVEQGLRRMQQHEFESHQELPIERYEWPLTAGILLLIASAFIRERKRVRAPRPAPAVARPAAAAAVATVALLLLVPARGWSKNEGVDLYDQKDYKGAYNTFQQQLEHNPDSSGLEFDRGAAAYKEGDYEAALDAFGKVLGAQDQGLRGQAEYNLANTLVQRGAIQSANDEKIKEWKDALSHYDQALKIDPKNVDASYNEEVVKRMIDDLNKKQQQQQQQQQDQQKQQQNKPNQNQQNQQNQQSQQNQQQQQQQQNQNQQQSQQSKQQQGQGQQQNQQAQQQQGQGQQQNQQAQQKQGQGQQQNQQAQQQQGQGQQQNQQAQQKQGQGQQQNQQAQQQQGQGQQQNQQAQQQQGQGQQQNQQAQQQQGQGQQQNQQAQQQQGQGQQQNQQAQQQQGQGQQQNQQAQQQQGQGQQQNQQAQRQQGQGQQQNQQAQRQQGQGQQQNQQAQQQQGQGQQGQQNQPQGGSPNSQQTAQNEQNPGSGSPQSGAPSPTPANGPGVLKENSQKDQQADAQAAARAATEQARPGEMTPSQAQALIDSLRGEDEHVSLYDRQKNPNEASYKDW